MGWRAPRTPLAQAGMGLPGTVSPSSRARSPSHPLPSTPSHIGGTGCLAARLRGPGFSRGRIGQALGIHEQLHAPFSAPLQARQRLAQHRSCSRSIRATPSRSWYSVQSRSGRIVAFSSALSSTLSWARATRSTHSTSFRCSRRRSSLNWPVALGSPPRPAPPPRPPRAAQPRPCQEAPARHRIAVAGGEDAIGPQGLCLRARLARLLRRRSGSSDPEIQRLDGLVRAASVPQRAASPQPARPRSSPELAHVPRAAPRPATQERPPAASSASASRSGSVRSNRSAIASSAARAFAWRWRR